MGGSQSVCTKNELNSKCQDICKTLNKPVLPKIVNEWILYNDTNYFVVIKFSGKDSLIDIDNDSYYKRWEIKLDGSISIMERLQGENVTTQNNIIDIPGIYDIQNIQTEMMNSTDVYTTTNININSPDGDTIPQIVSTKLASKLSIPIEEIDTTFIKSNEKLDKRLFDDISESEQVGGVIEDIFFGSIKDEEKKAFIENFNEIKEKIKPFIILDPKTKYSFNKIFNFYPFVIATIEKEVTNKVKLEPKHIKCVGAIYPSEGTVKISELKSNDILDSFKNNICKEMVDI